ncbi:class I SAM-dependent methyltransferase [Streptomyces sp. 4N124]|uniref:class I SAM-dependent methyltransferase n=1 Tax=Streptomyces sp. 4N124 TaxID=3457420 RepID=UPI003FD6AE73
MTQHTVRLGTVQETLLIPLYGRAVENRKPEPALRDARAEEIVASIDYDFARFDDGPSLLGSVLRTSLFDRWVRDFVAEHPEGTVVEIGTGLNTRYERVDNGRVRWFDLDLPDVVDLRRTFFTDTPRRTMIPASVTDASWAESLPTDGPYFFAAEAVLPYLEEKDVQRVVDLLADRFPGSLLAFDTTGPGMIDTQDEHDALSKVDARLTWNCTDPARLAEWRPGVQVLASHTLVTLPSAMYDELPRGYQEMLTGLAAMKLPQVEDYRLNLVRLP